MIVSYFVVFRSFDRVVVCLQWYWDVVLYEGLGTNDMVFERVGSWWFFVSQPLQRADLKNNRRRNKRMIWYSLLNVGYCIGGPKAAR